MTGLPVRPAGRPPPRDLLALLEAHVGTAAAAALCAELLADDDPAEHRETLLFLGGAAGRSCWTDGILEALLGPRLGCPRPALRLGRRGRPGRLDGLRDEHWRVAEMCLKVAALRELPCGDDAVRLAAHELSRVRAAAARALGACGDIGAPVRRGRRCWRTRPRTYGGPRHGPSSGRRSADV